METGVIEKKEKTCWEKVFVVTEKGTRSSRWETMGAFF